MRNSPSLLSLLVLIQAFSLAGCDGDPADPGVDHPPKVDRIAAIPEDVTKITPDQDQHPPILHSDEFQEPVPLPVISTAGAEDAPFITPDGAELYFFFAADVRLDASEQIRNPVNGIWLSHRSGSTWMEPELVWLQEEGEMALNGCPWVGENEMFFCSARQGHAGVHWFRAERTQSGWGNWEIVSFPSSLDVGELHIHRDTMYYGSPRSGGNGGQDIWMAVREDGSWGNPENVQAVNTPLDESRPYLTPDGGELWVTRWHEGSPAVVRSRKVGNEWGPGELVVSRFAGEPTLDAEGNLYFVHHFYREGVMLEADIYVACRK